MLKHPVASVAVIIMLISAFALTLNPGAPRHHEVATPLAYRIVYTNVEASTDAMPARAGWEPVVPIIPTATPAPIAVSQRVQAIKALPDGDRYVTLPQFAALARSAGWRDDDVAQLTTFGLRESGTSLDGRTKNVLDPYVVSPTGDHGLMQLNAVHFRPGGIATAMGYTLADAYVPIRNLQIALALHDASCGAPWYDCWHPWR